MEKFDKIKDEMSENGKKFESYQAQVETKKLEKATLESEIECIRLAQMKYKQITEEVDEEKKRTVQQVDTLRKLKSALEMQVKQLGGTLPVAQDDKENSSVPN